MKVKFKKLNPKAVAPTKAHDHDAGFDLTATSWEYNNATETVKMGTGIAVQIPAGHVGYIFPRSSIYKKPLILANSVGVIDSGYNGEISFFFKESSKLWGKSYREGERIGQLIIMPIPSIEFEEVDELDDSDRGEGGFGSTGE